ncbi:MAG: hypothetical protein M1816_005506 [Peltula sp. TS41687]|nr:MAG: hypothetical protein M1816_005506 [Peltula sp. TS41687]
MAYLLNAAALQNWRESFESELLITLCVPVQILESVVNPKIQLNSWLWKLIETYAPPRPFKCDEDSPIHSIQLQGLAKIPDFIRDPEQHLFEIQSAYQQMRADAPKLR